MGVTASIPAFARALGVLAVAWTLGSTAACAPLREAAPPTVSLRMRGTPADAVVIIDDQALGTLELVATRGVALPPGVHHVTVKATGYLPWDREVDAKLDEKLIRLQVTLTPVPD